MTLKEQDIKDGTAALKQYFNWMKSFYPKLYASHSFDSFYQLILKIKGGKAVADGLGGAIRETKLSTLQVDKSMKNLAMAGGGKIPASFMDFINSLSGEASKLNYVDAAVFVVAETTKDIVKGVESVGESLLTTGKIVNFFLPVIVIGGLLLWANDKTNGGLVRGLKDFKSLK